jgi:ubiquinone/menaquinone biosynthesis C-methylase UbiE
MSNKASGPAGRSPAGRASAALPLLDDGTASPASRRLASARPALAPKCEVISAQALSPLIPLIESPVLVVGAGQGLLVEELRRKGFSTEGIDLSPQRVAYAEKRRGIKLLHANANDMPFQDGQFKTSIIATGVVDFMDKTDQIGAIINEVKRVTDAQGEIFVASMGMTPQTEELLQYIGIMSDSNQLSLRMAVQMFSGPKGYFQEILAAIRKDPNKSILGYAIRGIQSFMSMRKRTMVRIKSWHELKKKVKNGEIPDPKILLDYLPERIFCRSKEQIHELFRSLNFTPQRIFVFDNCKIAQL